MKKKRILLVSAVADFAFSGWVEEVAQSVRRARAFIAPVNIATVAALTPPEYDVTLWDEIVQGPSEQALDAGYDLVGVSSYLDQLDRAIEIAAAFRARGITAVIGGAGVTTRPEDALGKADAIFVGEAETTWPQFLAEWEAGTHRSRYDPETLPDLTTSPPPRWDSIADKLSANYKSGAIQINRGCPHRCEFCNVWVKFGRKIRTKPIPQVLDELRTLEGLGMKRAMFCSDNFIGDPRYAKELLRAVVPVNDAFKYPLTFNTELTVKVADDEELLGLFARAGFTTFFIGIESPNVDSLLETHKYHNTKSDLVKQCLRINSYGIPIVGSMIVGFDSDGPGIFDAHFRFLQDAHIPYARMNLLKAGKGTALYDRMVGERRVIHLERTFPGHKLSNSMMSCNVMPRGLPRSELYRGYLGLLERVRDWRNFGERMLGFIDDITRIPERRPDDRLLPVAKEIRQMLVTSPGVDVDVVEAIYARASERVPVMLWEVMSIVLMQRFDVDRLKTERADLEAQIRLEEQLEARGEAVLETLA